MKLPIELIVFDIAGTTLSDKGEIAQAFREALLASGYDVPVEQINPLMGYKKTEAIRRLISGQEVKSSIPDSEVQVIHQRFLNQMIHYYAAEELAPLPYAEEVFTWLRERGIRVGLDTGFSNEITEVIINRLGWLKEKKIDFVVSSNEVPAGRPAPFMIQKMMELADIHDAGKVVKVGDTEVDVQEGRNAGCLYSIAITTGAFSREELEPFEPSFIIDSLQELIPIIESL
jgi:phosphonatase-like hydrolase